MKRSVSCAAILLLAMTVFVHAADDMAAFPPAEKGMVRYVLQLPEQPDETLLKVELIVGKTVQVDKENRYFFAGQIETHTIAGWGYILYTVRELGSIGGTLMAVDPHAPKVDRFVTLRAEPYLIRYNSLLPVVVYVPKGVEVRYRIWSSEDEIKPMEEG